MRLLERKLMNALELLEELKKRISLIESIFSQFKENIEIVEYLKTIFGIVIFPQLTRLEMDRIKYLTTSNKLCAYTALISSAYSSGSKIYHDVPVYQECS